MELFIEITSYHHCANIVEASGFYCFDGAENSCETPSKKVFLKIDLFECLHVFEMTDV